MSDPIFAPTFRGVLSVGTAQWRQGERLTDRQWYADATQTYLIAASLARNRCEEQLAVVLAWCAQERSQGRISKLEGVTS